MRRVLLALLLAAIMLPTLNLGDDKSQDMVKDMVEEKAEIAEEWQKPYIFPALDWWELQQEVDVLVLTDDLSMLHQWQQQHRLLPKQQTSEGRLIETNPESLQGDVQHRLVTMPGNLVSKLLYLDGIRAITLDLENPEPADSQAQPSTFKAVEIHGATDAWQNNISGNGVKVAIVDSGVDFAHPDLNGTQARDDNLSSPWYGWPIAHDPRSLNEWLKDGDTYPSDGNSWFADTSTIDTDSDNNSLLDTSGYDVSGIPSISGSYRIGEHPDGNLQSRVGDDVPILLTDSTTAGVYDSVYVDMDGDDSFADEFIMNRGNETTGLDLNDDGLWDRSGGMIYFIADGNTSLPYGPTLAARQGYADRIPNNGDIVAFMLNEASGPAGNHGTLCASAVSAQGIVASGKVQGMAPNATIIGVGNYYNGGSGLDTWRFVAEGPDGLINTGDEAQIGSFSFGYSGVVDAGSDFNSLYLDWITRVHSPKTVFMVAMGNGGPGYGTVTSPSGAAGVFSVGAATSKTGGSIGDTHGDMAMWSDRGPNSQGRMDPDIVAIGWSATGDKTLNEKTNANSAYGSWGGTSLATPLAAGLMALVQQAWFEEYGSYPDSQTIRDLVMSTADDISYEALVQGAGWFNASRAIHTIAGSNDTWWLEPAVLMPGENDGAHRVANSNWLMAGDVVSHSVQINNPQSASQQLNFTSETFEATTHQNFTWLSNTSMGWDGYQSSRPDFVVPLLIHNDSNNTSIDATATMIRARASTNPLGFDGNQDRQSENRIYLYTYRWNDSNGDGMYWDDSNNDSFIQDGEWQSSEVSVMTASYFTGPQSETRATDPWEEDCDGILLAIFREEVRTGLVDPLDVQIDITGFSKVSDSWISVPSSRQVQANSSRNISITVAVPSNAIPGLHMSGIRVDDGRGHDWLLPIIATVAVTGPYSWIPPTVDNNLSNQSLYRETWMQGAQRWGWRAESGDWKAFGIDWPANMTDGTIIIDVDWPDNGHTDIDAFWLSETSHPFAADDPIAYGTKNMYIETGSDIEHAGSGIWRRETTTGADRELLSAEASAGHKILLLHSTMHGVLTNDNPVNVTVGYAATLSGNMSKTVVNWSQGDFNEGIIIGSTADVNLSDVSGYGWTEPMYWSNETASQDTPSDKSSSSYIRNLTLQDIEYLKVQIDSNRMGEDLDLYLYRDKNSNGVIDWSSELMETSGGGGSNEICEVNNPANGKWWIVVHGYDLASNNTTFWLQVKMVGGYSLIVDNYSELNNSQILSNWPGGSAALGGQIPLKAWQVNLTILRPQRSGIFSGYVSLELESGGTLEVPYEYRLLALPAQVKFISPNNGTHHNETVNISAYIYSQGSGVNLSNISLEGAENFTSIMGVDTDGLEINRTDLNSTELARELWLNFSLPANETEQYFQLNVSDFEGSLSRAELYLTYDISNPQITIPGYVAGTWLTNNTFWNLSVISETDISLETEQGLLVADDGYYNTTLQLDLEGLNQFNITATDKAGNSVTTLLLIERDTIAPSLEMRSDAIIGVVNTSSVLFEYQVELGARLWIQSDESFNPSNFIWNQHSLDTRDGDFIVELSAQDEAGNWQRKSLTFRVDTIFPVVQWLDPAMNETLEHHLIPLAWTISENTSTDLLVDGIRTILPQSQTGRNTWVHTLESLEGHTLCLQATDEGRNSIVSCIEVVLPTSLYTPELTAQWDGKWVNSSEVIAQLYLGPGQTWRLNTTPPVFGIGLGEWLNITIPLEEGSNHFTLTVSGMTIHEEWRLEVMRDSQTPFINISSPNSRIAFVADDIPDRYPPIDVQGIASPNVDIRCDVEQTGAWSQTTSDSDGHWELGLTPWQDWRDMDLDNRQLTIICSATDLAQNSVISTLETILDTTPPSLILEFIGDLDGLYLRHDIISSDGISYWNLSLTRNGEPIQTYDELQYSGQLSLQAVAGTWNATLLITDSAGHSTIISTQLTLTEEERTLGSILESAGGIVNLSIGFVIAIGVLALIFRPRKEDEEVLGVPMDRELFFDAPEVEPISQPLVNVQTPATAATPGQRKSLLAAAEDLLED